MARGRAVVLRRDARLVAEQEALAEQRAQAHVPLLGAADYPVADLLFVTSTIIGVIHTPYSIV